MSVRTGRALEVGNGVAAPGPEQLCTGRRDAPDLV